MTISVLTRILSDTVFDKIGTKKSNLALKRLIRKLELSDNSRCKK